MRLQTSTHAGTFVGSVAQPVTVLAFVQSASQSSGLGAGGATLEAIGGAGEGGGVFGVGAVVAQAKSDVTEKSATTEQRPFIAREMTTEIARREGRCAPSRPAPVDVLLPSHPSS